MDIGSDDNIGSAGNIYDSNLDYDDNTDIACIEDPVVCLTKFGVDEKGP